MKISLSENKLKAVLLEMLPSDKAIQSRRPDKLKNLKTGENLEIDISYKKYLVGFEYQGEGHFSDLKVFNYSSDKVREHDLIKHDRIMENPNYGNSIIEIFPQDLIGNIKNNILQRLIKNQQYYFDSKHFKKAYNIERFILCYLNGISIVRWNDLVGKNKKYSFQSAAYLKLASSYMIGASIKEKASLVYKLSKFNYNVNVFNHERSVLNFDYFLKVMYPLKTESVYLRFLLKAKNHST